MTALVANPRMPQTLLLVGDERILEPHLVETLLGHGYALETIAASLNGWRGMATVMPDLILCPSTQPNLPALLAALGNHTDLMRVPILIITSPGNSPTFERAWLPVAAPITLVTSSALLITIETWLGSARRGDAYRLPSALSSFLPDHFTHEYNTPLTSILGFAYLLQQAYKQEEEGQVASMLAMIIASGQRLKRTLDNLQLANALLGGPVGAPPWLSAGDCPVSAALAGQIGQDMSLRYDQPVPIQMELEETLVCLSAEALQKVLEELLDNALKFSHPPGCIELRGYRQPPFYCLSLTNQGPGLNADDLANVGLYTQFNRSIHQQQGLGAGLFIVRQLVEYRCGQLAIFSQPTGPTSVVVKLWMTRDQVY
jgi:two-component system sensor histidine kinase/response regulator